VISSKIGHSLDPFILKVYRVLPMGKTISPNALTLLGAVVAFAAALVILFGRPVLGAFVLAFSGLLDLMDGALARSTDRITPFGGFLDSVLDRYSDLLIMGAILIRFAAEGNMFDVIATCIAAIGVALIPYVKARADAAGLPSNTGLLERPERIIILLCGLCFGLLHYAILVLAVLTHVTVLQRIIHAKSPSLG
jgi:phosphatidylglycerophosphate synthase